MYRITSNNITRYSDSITHICLNTNGSYNLCPAADAEGFVAKVPTVCTDDSGNAHTALMDTVYRYGDGLHGTELVGVAEETSGAEMLTGYEAALTSLGVLPLPDEEVTDDAE